MNIIDIITKKRDNQPLTKDEIDYFVQNYTNGNIADYQASALTMAICLNGMNEEETKNLSLAMANSGERLDLSEISDIIVDKHSSGGVGDKVTLIVMPIVSALGVKVAKMSGRGLGITGGTIDKLESITGYRTNLSIEEFKQNVKKIGISLIGQTGNLAPADKKLYALRDVTGTVESLPLIASSIMSKKMASGANKLVLEVTCGKGAFMKTQEDAENLAKTMKKLGDLSGIETTCVITNMNEPIGKAVRKLTRSRRSKRRPKRKNAKRRKSPSIRNISSNNKTIRTRKQYRRKQKEGPRNHRNRKSICKIPRTNRKPRWKNRILKKYTKSKIYRTTNLRRRRLHRKPRRRNLRKSLTSLRSRQNTKRRSNRPLNRVNLGKKDRRQNRKRRATCIHTFKCRKKGRRSKTSIKTSL